MMAKIVTRNIWYADGSNPMEVGWYYQYDITGMDYRYDTTGMEHGPFPTEEEARHDAEAAFPVGWALHDDQLLSLDDFDSLPGDSPLRDLGRIPTYLEAYKAHGKDWS